MKIISVCSSVRPRAMLWQKNASFLLHGPLRTANSQKNHEQSFLNTRWKDAGYARHAAIRTIESPKARMAHRILFHCSESCISCGSRVSCATFILKGLSYRTKDNLITILSLASTNLHTIELKHFRSNFVTKKIKLHKVHVAFPPVNKNFLTAPRRPQNCPSDTPICTLHGKWPAIAKKLLAIAPVQSNKQ